MINSAFLKKNFKYIKINIDSNQKKIYNYYEKKIPSREIEGWAL